MREVYISVDVEAAGPLPPTYSMLSLGAVAVDDPKATFYVELRPVNDNFGAGSDEGRWPDVAGLRANWTRSERGDGGVSGLA